MKELTKICSKGDCIHNGEPQPISNFCVDRKRTDGLTPWCKDCLQKYRDSRSKEKVRAYNQKYQEEHLEEIKKYRRKHHLENKEKDNAKLKEWQKSPAKYKTYFTRLSKYDECRLDPDNSELFQVRCKNSKCREWFNPTNDQVTHRLAAINSTTLGEANFYCSNECKQSCSIYKKKTFPEGTNPNTSRYSQTELRELVIDQNGCVCEKCGRSKEDHPNLIFICHHIDPVINNPVESADIDNCVILCNECHQWIHKNIPGCAYSDLNKCSSSI